MKKSKKMRDKIKNLIKSALMKLEIGEVDFVVEHPEDLMHGDYATNVAMIAGKKLGKNPAELAGKLAEVLRSDLKNSPRSDLGNSKIETVGGFVNFFLAPEFFSNEIKNIISQKENYGRGGALAGQKAIVEYTDPNPFKEFHIGHLMANTIGEAVSRIIQWNGAEVRRACYQGDVGLHVAKAVWAMARHAYRQAGEKLPDETSSLSERMRFLGRCYAAGAKAYEAGEKEAVEEINRKIFSKQDLKINHLYQTGRQWSLEYFESIYKILGTKFDFYFFESTAGDFGAELVREWVEKGIFEKSDGAIIFRGENHGLHTRVFVNSQGLPTYEAKELGLAKIKYDLYPYDQSVVVTGNEQSDYFKVVLKALSLVFPELAAKTRHISHGMLRLPSGKMSSRTGEVVTAESLLVEISGRVREKISAQGGPASGWKKSNKITQATDELVNQVAVAALKYSILKQAIGRDIIFDFDKSLSFEGDSGPYLQYSHARAKSILKKAKAEGIADFLRSDLKNPKRSDLSELTEVERLLYRLPEVIERALRELAPQHVASYLIELCRAFNSFYGAEKIVDKNDPASPRKVSLTTAFAQVLKNGLSVLGISAPEEM